MKGLGKKEFQICLDFKLFDPELKVKKKKKVIKNHLLIEERKPLILRDVLKEQGHLISKERKNSENFELKTLEKLKSEQVLDDLIKGIKEKCEELHRMKIRYLNEIKETCNIELTSEEIQSILKSFPEKNLSPESLSQYFKTLSEKYKSKLLKTLQTHDIDHQERLTRLKSSYKLKIIKSKQLLKTLSTLHSHIQTQDPSKSLSNLTSTIISENLNIRSQLNTLL